MAFTPPWYWTDEVKAVVFLAMILLALAALGFALGWRIAKRRSDIASQELHVGALATEAELEGWRELAERQGAALRTATLYPAAAEPAGTRFILMGGTLSPLKAERNDRSLLVPTLRIPAGSAPAAQAPGVAAGA